MKNDIEENIYLWSLSKKKNESLQLYTSKKAVPTRAVNALPCYT